MMVDTFAEHSHEPILTSVRTSLNLNNPNLDLKILRQLNLNQLNPHKINKKPHQKMVKYQVLPVLIMDNLVPKNILF